MKFSDLETDEEKLDLMNKKEILLIKENRKLLGKNKIFNVRDGGYNTFLTDEQKLERSEWTKEYYQSPEGMARRKEHGELMKEFYESPDGIALKEQLSVSQKGKHISPETEFTSEDTMGKKNHFYGKTHTPETKKYISDIQKGKVASEETKEKQTKSSLEYYQSPEGQLRKKNNSKRMFGSNNPYAKTYDLSLTPLISPTGEYFFKIVCAAQFARDNNLNSDSLSSLLNGKQKSHKGWVIKCS